MCLDIFSLVYQFPLLSHCLEDGSLQTDITLLHSGRPKLYTLLHSERPNLAFLSAIGWAEGLLNLKQPTNQLHLSLFNCDQF